MTIQGALPGPLTEQAGGHQQPKHHDAQQLARPLSESPMSIEAIYRLIGENHNHTETATALTNEQQQQIRRLQQQQLQAAASAESNMVGTWLALPHQVVSTSGRRANIQTAEKGRESFEQTQAATHDQQRCVVASGQSQPAATDQLFSKYNLGSKAAWVDSKADGCFKTAEDSNIAASGAGKPECSQQNVVEASMLEDKAIAQHLSMAAALQQRSTDMYRARHSTILHVAVAKALNKP